jgi:hypothetical protein
MLTFNKSSGEKCTVKLNDYNDSEDIHVFNQLICTATDEALEFSPIQERTSAQLL